MTTSTNGTACNATGTGNPGAKTPILFLLAGSVTLIGVLLSAAVSRWFLLIPTLVGANQLLMAATGRALGFLEAAPAPSTNCSAS